MISSLFKRIVWVVLFIFSSAVYADMTVSGWVAQSVTGSKVGAAYIEIDNNSAASRSLSSVITHVSSHTMIHNIEEVDGVKRMRHMESWSLPPYSKSIMKPGSVHVMMMGIKPLKAGDKVPFTLKFANGEELQVLLPVKQI